MKNMSGPWKWIGSALLLAGVGIGVWFAIASRNIPLTRVGLSPKWFNQAQFAGIFTAQGKHFYRDAHLDVDIHEFGLGRTVLDDMKSGRSDFGLMSANEFLVHRSRGESLMAVAAFYQISPYIIVSLPQKGITSPAEFTGKTLGLKGGSSGEALTIFDLLLASSGLSSKDMIFKTLGATTSERDDLVSGRADIVGLYRTRLYQFDQQGIEYHPIYPEQYGASLYNDVLVVRSDFLKEHPDVVRRFVHATVRGWEYAYAHQEEAIQLTLPYVTNDQYKDLAYERHILQASEALMRPVPSMQIGWMDLEHWQRYYDSLSSRKLFDQPFDIREAFTTDFLPR